MTKRRPYSIVALALLLIASLAQGQAKQDNPLRLTFDVASIRPSRPGAAGGMIKPLDGGHGYSVKNIPVKLMVSLMYKVPMRQISGGPNWLATDTYDIEARTDRPYGIDDLHAMFQNLLADRFNLKLHKEIKEGPAYVLTVDKSGPKMKLNESEPDFNIPITFGANNDFIGKRVSMQYFSWWLGQQLQRDQRPVIDKTGLDKNYDFTLVFAPDLPPENIPPGLLDRPTIFDALKDQLGLKLQAQPGPVDYYLIDHIDKPSEN